MIKILHLPRVFSTLCFIFILACGNDEDPKPTPKPKEKSKEAKITEFQFVGENQKASIEGLNITYTFPYGKDITNLKANITISAKASIKPESDPKKGINYTNPVKFTVTAEDGITKQEYTVRVNSRKNKQ